jgi:hypothetical protein
MKLMTMLVAALLVGCATTPADIKEARKGNRFESSQTPKAVANCLTRNHLHSGGNNAPLITESATGEIEYALKDTQYGLMQFYVVITPSGAGSSVTIWTLSPYLRDTIEAGMMKGC